VVKKEEKTIKVEAKMEATQSVPKTAVKVENSEKKEAKSVTSPSGSNSTKADAKPKQSLIQQKISNSVKK